MFLHVDIIKAVRENMSMDESLGKQTANEFLKYASEYANSIDNDDGFISEIAYIMTTLHMHGC